jgi:hypothetical protein
MADLIAFERQWEQARIWMLAQIEARRVSNTSGLCRGKKGVL